jgi:tRNA dimethylallyltransferase
MRSPAVAIIGPTATGKSAIALDVARRVPDVEIVSADAFLVYRGMDIGTAKPSRVERAEVRHHLVDVVDATDEYSLSRFVDDGRAALADIAARGKRALVVGGTGLYVRGLVDGLDVPGQWPAVRAELEAENDTPSLHRQLAQLDPVAAGRMEPTNRRRIVRALEVTLGSGRRFSSFGDGMASYPPIATAQVGIDVGVEILDRRIDGRVDDMIAAGLVDEVRGLAGAGLSKTAAQGVGYRQLLDHLRGDCPLDVALAETARATRRLARRQRSWFRRDPRVSWVAPEIAVETAFGMLTAT